MLRQSYSLICNVTGTENYLDSSIAYQWTKSNGTQTQVPNGPDPKTLSFSTLRFSDFGQYTCQATVSSPYLSRDITVMDTHDIKIQSTFGYPVHSCMSESVLRLHHAPVQYWVPSIKGLVCGLSVCVLKMGYGGPIFLRIFPDHVMISFCLVMQSQLPLL